jgi:Acetyltransferase (GNAT) domain
MNGSNLQVTSPAPQDVWADVLDSDPNALVTQSARWLQARCQLGGHVDASRLYETTEGRRLVLPLVRREGLGEGALAIRSSYGEGWGMGGLLGPGGITREDVATVVGDLLREPALRTLIRPNPLLAKEWAAARSSSAHAVPRLAHVLDLAGGFGHVWSRRFAPGARANVRKAERSGVTIERGSSERHVEAYYELFGRSLERWSRRQHEPEWLTRWRGHRRDPVGKLRTLARLLGGDFGIWIARLNDCPIAAAIVLRGVNAHYTRGVMDEDRAGPTRANYLLHRHAIEDACAAGCRHYHFGETGRSPSLAFFKTRFGAEPHAYAEYRFERVPLSAFDRCLRTVAKRLVGFSEPGQAPVDSLRRD